MSRIVFDEQMAKMEEICQTVEATMDAGKRMAATLSRGNVLSLEGDLGAGKTHFVKGLAAGFGVKGLVSSPTFTVIHEYETAGFPLYHVDFYRMESALEAQGIGLDDCFSSGVTVIEWGDRFPGLLPLGTRRIRFEILSETGRRLHYSGEEG